MNDFEEEGTIGPTVFSRHCVIIYKNKILFAASHPGIRMHENVFLKRGNIYMCVCVYSVKSLEHIESLIRADLNVSETVSRL